MVKVIIPIGKAPNNNIIIFLAGPIQGAENWQDKAIDILRNEITDCVIANPRREYIDDEFEYNKQVEWETEYLNKAAKNGVIMFWLAKEMTHFCNRAYAQTTRFELAEWKTKYHYNKKINLVIGIEDGFTNERYIRKRMKEDCPDIHIEASLKDTCRQVIKIVKELKM